MNVITLGNDYVWLNSFNNIKRGRQVLDSLQSVKLLGIICNVRSFQTESFLRFPIHLVNQKSRRVFDELETCPSRSQITTADWAFSALAAGATSAARLAALLVDPQDVAIAAAAWRNVLHKNLLKADNELKMVNTGYSLHHRRVSVVFRTADVGDSWPSER